MLRLISVGLQLDAAVVLDGLTLEARPGELLLVQGPRASGKTKLLEIAGARRRPDSGQVWIADHNLADLQWDSLPFVRRNIGFASAAPRLLSGASVLENVMLPLAARDEAVGYAREAALRALGKVGAVGLATQDPRALSAAGRRLVEIARALAGAPPLVLLDDPGAGLSVADQGAVLAALASAVERGAAVMCAATDAVFVEAAERVGARRIALEAGRIAAGGGPVAAAPAHTGRAPLRSARPEARS